MKWQYDVVIVISVWFQFGLDFSGWFAPEEAASISLGHVTLGELSQRRPCNVGCKRIEKEPERTTIGTQPQGRLPNVPKCSHVTEMRETMGNDGNDVKQV